MSSLKNIVSPAHKSNRFATVLSDVCSSYHFCNALQIGSSPKFQSTQILIETMCQNTETTKIFCLESSPAKFEVLKNSLGTLPFLQCYHATTIPFYEFPSPTEIKDFYLHTQSKLNDHLLPEVLRLLKQEVDYIKDANLPVNGIEILKQSSGLATFDLVLVNGEGFAGKQELDLIDGATCIALYDIHSYKNTNFYLWLSDNSKYRLFDKELDRNNSFAVFILNTAVTSKSAESHDSIRSADCTARYFDSVSESLIQELPIHFFSIVLNGEPFIRYHLDMFKSLPVKWHWHIIEGVAEHKHDTAWSLANGASIPDSFHLNGLSIDGTTEYLNKIEAQYPENISIYRNEPGRFWDGKLEMINAPLVNIRERSLLWQVDVDEIWTAEQIVNCWKLFKQYPERDSALYYCHYFVSPQLITTARNCYGNQCSYEWLRTWRFEPGMYWASHEPPKLGKMTDAGWTEAKAPFYHEETEAAFLVFQHFAYATSAQLEFKEKYYGYQNALFNWQRLQANSHFPVKLANFFPWVKDNVEVDFADKYGVYSLLSQLLS